MYYERKQEVNGDVTALNSYEAGIGNDIMILARKVVPNKYYTMDALSSRTPKVKSETAATDESGKFSEFSLVA